MRILMEPTLAAGTPYHPAAMARAKLKDFASRCGEKGVSVRTLLASSDLPCSFGDSGGHN